MNAAEVAVWAKPNSAGVLNPDNVPQFRVHTCAFKHWSVIVVPAAILAPSDLNFFHFVALPIKNETTITVIITMIQSPLVIAVIFFTGLPSHRHERGFGKFLISHFVDWFHLSSNFS